MIDNIYEDKTPSTIPRHHLIFKLAQHFLNDYSDLMTNYCETEQLEVTIQLQAIITDILNSFSVVSDTSYVIEGLANAPYVKNTQLLSHNKKHGFKKYFYLETSFAELKNERGLPISDKVLSRKENIQFLALIKSALEMEQQSINNKMLNTSQKK